MKRVDMLGTSWGVLKVIRQEAGTTRVSWRCLCRCGNETVVSGVKLRNGHTRSCGCMRRPAWDRFMEKVSIAPSGCLEWTGGLNGSGYGQFYVGMEKNPNTGKGYAHRWAYEHFVGAIPEGLHLDHLCRNRKCCNPNHLQPVTMLENIRRGVGPSSRNARKTHCPKGHEYSGDNLYEHPRKNMRYCRTCNRARAQAARDSAKALKE